MQDKWHVGCVLCQEYSQQGVLPLQHISHFAALDSIYFALLFLRRDSGHLGELRRSFSNLTQLYLRSCVNIFPLAVNPLFCLPIRRYLLLIDRVCICAVYLAVFYIVLESWVKEHLQPGGSRLHHSSNQLH